MLAVFKERASLPNVSYQLTADRLREPHWLGGGWSDRWLVQLFADERLLCEAVAEDYSEVLAVEDWFKERMRSSAPGH
jgi:hypothetical protein